jgi:hypothetical protein
VNSSAAQSPDIRVSDQEDRVFMVFEVKRRPIDQLELQEVLSALDTWRNGHPVEYLGVADLNLIRVFRLDRAGPPQQILSLPTADVLSAYDPDFRRREVFEPYLEALVRNWLRDFAVHWKHPNPPGQHELQQAGIAQRLRNGYVESPPPSSTISEGWGG